MKERLRPDVLIAKGDVFLSSHPWPSGLITAVVVGACLAPFVDAEKVIGTIFGLAICLPLVVIIVRWLAPTGGGHDDSALQVFLASLLRRDGNDHIDSP